MSIRLQVVLDDEEIQAVREDAARHGVTVSEWVRSALRDARRQVSPEEPARKLSAIRAAAKHNFPTGDIEQILAEIEKGYVTH